MVDASSCIDCHLPDGDIGYWTACDGGTGIWIDLPDKQGLLYATSMGYGASGTTTVGMATETRSRTGGGSMTRRTWPTWPKAT